MTLEEALGATYEAARRGIGMESGRRVMTRASVVDLRAEGRAALTAPGVSPGTVSGAVRRLRPRSMAVQAGALRATILAGPRTMLKDRPA